uniref:Uncharacterized protein n=1 Tax=Haptolina brevifila TaxID=156173 RepID=A0A7S2C3P9_9EUKA|mmetsp:Transcript_19808/g.40337  ORF Transcript_19808/g.40337 Transcript_19808/m.40337 type:complete len:260 (+) Transcript_19808:362-1141(+)
MAQEANKATLDLELASAGADAQAAQAATPLESLTTVLGSTSGGTLRRIARDLDSTSLLIKLSSSEARNVRRLAVKQISKALETSVRGATRRAAAKVAAPFSKRVQDDVATASPVQEWPSSETAEALERRTTVRAKTTAALLLRTHLDKQVAAGWRGVAASVSLLAVTLRVGLAALVRAAVRLTFVLPAKVLPDKVVATAAAGAAFLISKVGREISGVGRSLTALGEELSGQAKSRSAKGGAAEDESDDAMKKYPPVMGV